MRLEALNSAPANDDLSSGLLHRDWQAKRLKMVNELRVAHEDHVFSKVPKSLCRQLFKAKT